MDQDWTEVKFTKKTPKAGSTNKKAVTTAQQSGTADVETIRKCKYHSNESLPASVILSYYSFLALYS